MAQPTDEELERIETLGAESATLLVSHRFMDAKGFCQVQRRNVSLERAVRLAVISPVRARASSPPRLSDIFEEDSNTGDADARLSRSGYILPSSPALLY